jgi:hypothetical protein
MEETDCHQTNNYVGVEKMEIHTLITYPLLPKRPLLIFHHFINSIIIPQVANV